MRNGKPDENQENDLRNPVIEKACARNLGFK